MNYLENTYAHDASNNQREREYNDGMNDNDELLEFYISFPESSKDKYKEVINELQMEGWKPMNGTIKNGITTIYLSKKVNP